LGYYHQNNTGDDGFQVVFNYLQKKYYDDFVFDFYDSSSFPIDKIQLYDVVIAGGGDIIGPYFMEKLKSIKERKQIKIVAISVGIPYISSISMYGKYIDEFYIRNSNDVEYLRQILPDKKISYYPDLCYLLPKVYSEKINYEKLFPSKFYHIGIYLARPYYNPKNEKEYFNMVTKLSDVFNNLVKKKFFGKEVKIHLIPFGLRVTNDKENDDIINRHVKILMRNSNVTKMEIATNNSSENENYISPKDLKNVHQLYSIMSHMNYNICARFHSHIFSLIHRTPFVSIASTRKCKELIKNIGLESNIYPIKLNESNVPIDLEVPLLTDFIVNLIENQGETMEKINNYMDQVGVDLDNFVEIFKKLF